SLRSEGPALQRNAEDQRERHLDGGRLHARRIDGHRAPSAIRAIRAGNASRRRRLPLEHTGEATSAVSQDGGKDEVHAALMKRAQVMSRRFTLIVIATALFTSFALVYFAVGDFFGRSGVLFA